MQVLGQRIIECLQLESILFGLLKRCSCHCLFILGLSIFLVYIGCFSFFFFVRFGILLNSIDITLFGIGCVHLFCLRIFEYRRCEVVLLVGLYISAHLVFALLCLNVYFYLLSCHVTLFRFGLVFGLATSFLDYFLLLSDFLKNYFHWRRNKIILVIL